MKEVTVLLRLLINNDQPVADWIPDAIDRNLSEDEQILVYFDDESIVSA